MKQSPARIALVLLFVFIGCFGTAFAAAGMLTALPAPAVGGTCGPSTASETALEALAEPGSIGAGPRPPTSNATAYHQWTTFVQQCQALADRRGLASLAIFVISVSIAAVGLIWVLRRPRGDDGSGETVDGSTDWLAAPGTDDARRLVGAGASIAPPSAYGPAPYPVQQQGWPAQPVAPYPYPYPAAPAPAYPAPAPAYPQAPLPPPPAYTQAPPPPPAYTQAPPPPAYTQAPPPPPAYTQAPPPPAYTQAPPPVAPVPATPADQAPVRPEAAPHPTTPQASPGVEDPAPGS